MCAPAGCYLLDVKKTPQKMVVASTRENYGGNVTVTRDGGGRGRGRGRSNFGRGRSDRGGRGENRGDRSRQLRYVRLCMYVCVYM